MAIAFYSQVPSFEKFVDDLIKYLSFIVDIENIENHIIPFRVEYPDGSQKNKIFIGKNATKEARANFNLDNNIAHAYDGIGWDAFLKSLYNDSKAGRSVFIIANGIDQGTTADKIKYGRFFHIESDDLKRSIDEKVGDWKKFNLPRPSTTLLTSNKSAQHCYGLTELVTIADLFEVKLQFVRLTCGDGCASTYDDGNASIKRFAVQSYRLPGFKHQKTGKYSKLLLNHDDIYTPDGFREAIKHILDNPLGEWDKNNGDPEKDYSFADVLSPEWRSKFKKFDPEEKAKAIAHHESSSKLKQQPQTANKKASSSTTTLEPCNIDLSAIASDKLAIVNLLKKDYKALLNGVPADNNRWYSLWVLANDLICTEKALETLKIQPEPTAFSIFNAVLDRTYGSNNSKKQEAIEDRWKDALGKSGNQASCAIINSKIKKILKLSGVSNPETKPTEPQPTHPTEQTEPQPTQQTKQPGWGAVVPGIPLDHSVYSKVDGNWSRVENNPDDLHIVFDSALLKKAESDQPTIALPDVKQKSDKGWIDNSNQSILKPYVGKGRTIYISADAKNWTRENYIKLGGFCKSNGAGRVFIGDQDFEYFRVADELTLSGKDVKIINRDFLKSQEIIDLIEQEKAKAVLLQSSPGTNKTGAGIEVVIYLAIKHNIPILMSAATRSLCKGIAGRFEKIAGYKLPVVDDDWFKNKPTTKEHFKGAIFCPDSENQVNSILEELGISEWIYVCDEVSATTYHSHFSDTAIALGRAKHLTGISSLMSGATFSLHMEANITKPCSNLIESKIKGNVLKIRNDYQTSREFVVWKGRPHTMINTMVAVKKNLPDSTILSTTQARELDASLSPVNLKKYLVDQGFKDEDIILLDSESLADPSHPAHNIKTNKQAFDQFFSEYIKGKVVIGNPSMFSTGTNIDKHCIDYCFDILQGKGSPMSALQQPLRVRDREGLERHIFINNCGLDHPRYKGYSPEKIAKAIQEKVEKTNQEYEKLGGKADFSQIRTDLDSAEYAAHSQHLQTMFVKNYAVIAYGLMEHQQGWTLIESEEWLNKHTFSMDKEDFDTTQKLQFLPAEKDQILEDKGTKESFREIKKEGKEEIKKAIASAELPTNDQAKNLKNSRTELNQEEKAQLDRYDFHKATLGLVEATPQNIQIWKDGYYSKLRYQFYMIKDTQEYLRLKESKNIENNARDGHTFDFDRLAKSHLAAYAFLREIGADKLINEVRRIGKGLSTENHIYFKNAPEICSPSVDQREKHGLDPKADVMGLRLEMDKGSPLYQLAQKLKADPIKCYNLLGFTPVAKNDIANIEKLIEKFGYARATNGKEGKARKHYLILFDDSRELFFSHLLHQHKLSVFNEDHPDHEFVNSLPGEGNHQPITRDYQLAKNGLLNIKDGEPTILDLLDIGAASPLVEKVEYQQQSRQLELPIRL